MNLSTLKKTANLYYWELIDAPYRIDEKVRERMGCFPITIENENNRKTFVRTVKKMQTNSIQIGTSWLQWPVAKRTSFAQEGNNVIFKILDEDAYLTYRLIPIPVQTP